MAKFKFGLQNILDIKLKLETQQKIEYSLANVRLNEEQEKLRALELRRREYEEALRESQLATIDLQQVNFYKNAIETMKSLIRTQMFEVKKAEDAVEIERNKLDGMMKERKTYEKLKEHAFEDFKKELIADESKAIDGLVSFTYGAK